MSPKLGEKGYKWYNKLIEHSYNLKGTLVKSNFASLKMQPKHRQTKVSHYHQGKLNENLKLTKTQTYSAKNNR